MGTRDEAARQHELSTGVGYRTCHDLPVNRNAMRMAHWTANTNQYVFGLSCREMRGSHHAPIAFPDAICHNSTPHMNNAIK